MVQSSDQNTTGSQNTQTVSAQGPFQTASSGNANQAQAGSSCTVRGFDDGGAFVMAAPAVPQNG